jgi:anti-sigma B factor antagonist
MKLESTGRTLKISGLAELNASNASAFRERARAAILPEHEEVELDLSQTRFLDSSGLGALIALNKLMTSRQGHVRILNPVPAVQQILELTRMHRVFEISQS